MKNYRLFGALLGASAIIMSLQHSALAAKKIPATKVAANTNPLLTESTLPYQLPPFDKIRNEDFLPAIEQGMAEHLQESEKIANNKAKPTFENTIVAMERSGRLLQRAGRIFSNLNACNTNPEMQKIDQELSPKLSAHQDAIRLNSALFAACKLCSTSATNSGSIRNRNFCWSVTTRILCARARN